MQRILRSAILVVLLQTGLVHWAHADQNDPRLSRLFDDLHDATDPAQARTVEARIWGIWLESKSAAATVLVEQGIDAMNADDHALAMESFDAAIEFAPDYAEAWNKRATLFFMMGDYAASIEDVKRVLALEPRHFGAWSGLGQMYETMGNLEGALAAFERIRDIHPTMSGLDAQIESLKAAIRAKNI